MHPSCRKKNQHSRYQTNHTYFLGTDSLFWLFNQPPYFLKNKSAETRLLLGTAIGVGANYGVVLPFSRKHELEADRLGLIFMTMAGYDPREAISFWSRMASISGSGQKKPEFISTHPSDEHRIKEIQSLLPEMTQYKK